ncbi:MAG TPA: glucose 1-dehydrogenase [Caulobacteraceae bacterium]|jgi:NAD(P)-dependent dehydrogenase (short-subunit alcohol dehydrogenase family)|nr:glucose 1-dehydrogenase [Caulobacteraceae bacterium]
MSAGRLQDQVAVITGGASGIGFSTAERFLQEGAKVLIGDYNADAALAAVAALESDGHAGRIAFQRTDVSEEADVEALMTGARARWGALDVVFNNAGIGGAIGPIAETSVEHWDVTFAVLARGVFLGVKHAARIMSATGGGAIINTASIAGLAGGVIPTVYSAAKAAVVSFTRNAATELADARIRVNAVCPGTIFTPLMHGGRVAEAEAVVRQVQPWPDRGEPRHVADAVLFLASDESAFITGETLVVDGGYLANGLLRVHPLPGAKTKPDYAGMTYGLTGRPREVRRLPAS